MAAIDCKTIRDAVKDCLQADTTILYGSGKLIPAGDIISKEVEFEKAKVDVNSPYKIFLKCDTIEQGEQRAKNKDYSIACQYRVEGLAKDPQTAKDKCDDINERIDFLFSDQMWNGLQMTGFITNSESCVIDIDVSNIVGEAVGQDGAWRVHGEGELLFTINRVKP